MREDHAQDQGDQFEDVREAEEQSQAYADEQDILDDVNEDGAEQKPFDHRVVKVLLGQHERLVTEEIERDRLAAHE